MSIVSNNLINLTQANMTSSEAIKLDYIFVLQFIQITLYLIGYGFKSMQRAITFCGSYTILHQTHCHTAYGYMVKTHHLSHPSGIPT